MDHCPSVEQLSQVLADRLEVAERRLIEAHVEHCPLCQATLTRLTDDGLDEWRELLREEPSDADHAHNVDFLDSLKAQPPTDVVESSVSPSPIRFPGPPTELGPLGRLGRYHIQKELGAGAAGIVFLAFDAVAETLVALKVLKPELAAGLHGRARFEREARVAASVSHEHLVALLDAGDEETFALPFLVMEYVVGETLADRLRREGILSPREAARLVHEAAMGLAAVHGGGLVHRDVKPSNILVDASGHAKVSDFGVARIADASDEATNVRFTHSGHLVGTPAYMSPEQIQTPERIDVYGLGVVLYELLTGERPFRGSTSLVVQHILQRDPPAPRSLNRGIPADLETILGACLEKSPSKRYASAAAMADDLGRWLDGKPILARTPSPWVRGRRCVARHPLASGLVAASFMVFVLALAANWRLDVMYQEAITQRDAEHARRIKIEQTMRRAEQEARLSGDQKIVLDKIARTALRLPDEAAEALRRIPAERRGWEWHRFALRTALGPHAAAIVGTHEYGILDGLIDSDGLTLVTCGQDGRVIRWDLRTSGSKTLAEGRYCEEEGRWRSAIPLEKSSPSFEYFTRLRWVEQGIVVAGVSSMGVVADWDLRSGRRRDLWRGPHSLTAFAVAADGRSLLIGDARGGLVLLDREGGVVARLDELAGSAVADVEATGSGGWVVGQSNGSLSLVDATATRLVARERVAAPVWDLDLSRDGRRLAVACGEPSLRCFEVDEDDLTPRPDELYTTTRDGESPAFAFHAVRLDFGSETICAEDDGGRLHFWKRNEREPTRVRRDQWESRLSADEMERLPPPMRRSAAFLASSPDGRTLYTGGRSTTIKRWAIREGEGVTHLSDLGPDPRIEFDPIDPRLLWVGTADGSLAIRDSHTGARLVSVQAHDGRIAGVSMASKSQVVATTGSDRRIRFWTRVEHGIVPCGGDVFSERMLRSVAMSPEGDRLATYDELDQVGLWDVATGRLIKIASLRVAGTDAAVGGLVAFNRDGTLLAAAGPGQMVRLFAADTLEFREDPYLAVGQGATAIAWSPRDVDQLVVGDTVGRTASYPAKDQDFRTLSLPHRIVDVAFTPSADRFAAVARDGTIAVDDPKWLGRTIGFPALHPDPTAIRFDSRGERLAVAHRGGIVTIWETRLRASEPDVVAGRRWEVSKPLEGDRAIELFIRPAATVLDRSDRPAMLFTRRSAGPRRGQMQETVFARGLDGAYREELLAEFDTSTNRSVHETSVALLVDGGDVWRAYRRPSLASGLEGEMILSPAPVDGGGPGARGTRGLPVEESAFAQANWGFHTQLIPGEGGRPVAAHFSYHGYALMRSRWSEGTWKTTRWGRQGDGLDLAGAMDGGGILHLLFKPWRFGDDPAPLVYMAERECEHRETIDASADAIYSKAGGVPSIAVDGRGDPVVLYSRPGEAGTGELVVALRGKQGWTRRVVFDRIPPSVSNLVVDRTGRVAFVHADPLSRRISIASGRVEGERWRSEPVWDDENPEFPGGEEAVVQLVLLLDSRGRPVIVAARRSKEHGWLRVFRPTSEKQ